MRTAQLVSVIIPAWNAEATLREALESVGGQTYSELEILIVDDGSTDRTAAVAKDFCSAEPRARLISQANGGPAAARNRGIAEARGEWIALIDADDLWHPTKLEKQVAAALAAPRSPGFVYCWYRIIDDRGLVVASGPRWAVDGSAFRPLAYLHFIRGGSSLLLSKRALEEVGGFDESFREGCEDVLLELEIARRYPIVAVQEYLFGYRVGATSFTSDFDRILTGWRRAYARIQDGGRDIPAKVVRWVEAWCSFDLAEQRVLARSPRDSLGPLIRALALDPLRSGLRLLDRVTSVALRPKGRVSAQPETRHFYEVGTTEPIETQATGLRGISALLTRVDASRIRRLSDRTDVSPTETAQ